MTSPLIRIAAYARALALAVGLGAVVPVAIIAALAWAA